MLQSRKAALGLVCLGLLTAGCQTEAPPATTSSPQKAHDNSDGHQHDDGEHADHSHEHSDEATEAKVSAELAKLSPDDRKIAEAQKYCAVMSHERLGAMGPPLKLDIKGEPVFVCCKGCRQKALKNPDETLAKVAAMKDSNKAEH